MIRRIWAVVVNTFIEASRNKAFVAMAIIAVLFIVSSLAISQLSIEDQRIRVLIDFGLFSLSLASNLIAVVLGVILIHKEVDRKTFYLVVPKPVRRSEIVAGKFIGLASVILMSALIFIAVWFGVLHTRGVTINIELVKASYLVLLEVMVVLAVALFFSTFATPIISGIFALSILVIGRIQYILSDLLSSPKGFFQHYPATKLIAKATLAAFPDFSVFHVSRQLLLGINIPAQYVLSATGYALAWCVLFVALGMILFERRQFL